MTITISAAPKFCTQGRSECPEMSRLDPIHRGFWKSKTVPWSPVEAKLPLRIQNRNGHV